MRSNSQWEKEITGAELNRYLRGTHTLYSRLCNGERIFLVVPNGQKPKEHDGGYFSIGAALTSKGMK